MQHPTISTDGEIYVLAAGEAESVRRQTVDAVRRGGDVVRLPLLGGGEASVLFQPGVGVVLGTAEVDDITATGSEAAPDLRPDVELPGAPLSSAA